MVLKADRARIIIILFVICFSWGGRVFGEFAQRRPLYVYIEKLLRNKIQTVKYIEGCVLKFSFKMIGIFYNSLYKFKIFIYFLGVFNGSKRFFFVDLTACFKLVNFKTVIQLCSF